MIKETAPQVSVPKSILEDRIKNIKIICIFVYVSFIYGNSSTYAISNKINLLSIIY